jgi:hypothetical protein
MAPRCVGIAEPLTLPASLADVALTVGERRQVGGINRYVTSKIRVLTAKRLGAGVETRFQSWPVLAQLPG